MDPDGGKADVPPMDAIPGVGQLDLSNKISVAVAKKAMDMQKQEGASVLKLLESATNVQAEEAPASDGGLDVYG